MKEGIHPDYVDCMIQCSCGASFRTRATRSKIHVEICSSCHPFFTGQQKFVDTAGRVEKFRRRYGKRKAPGATAQEEQTNAAPSASDSGVSGQA